jgi:methylase of polypeptide subunit release factors
MARPDLTTLLPQLAERLRVAGYGETFLREKLAITHPDDVGLLNRAAAVERLAAQPDAASTLARLFYLESVETLAAARRALPDLAALARAQLFVVRGGRVRARLRIDAVQDLYVASDRRFESTDAGALSLPRGDMVYPPGSDSLILANLTEVREGARVLDLCTGSGVQGLLASRRASAVTAVDIGPRALAMTRANALLNRVSNVEARRGDLYAAGRGERYDVIIANPPFVPGPSRGPAYHSGGPLGDRVLARILGSADAHLAPGGRLFAVSHLAMRSGEEVGNRIAPWLANFGGRALVLLLESGTPVDLAAAQSLFALERGFAAYGREVHRWVKFLRRNRVDRILFVAVALERGECRAPQVVEAFQRTLPLPLSKAPRTLLDEWLAG